MELVKGKCYSVKIKSSVCINHFSHDTCIAVWNGNYFDVSPYYQKFIGEKIEKIYFEKEVEI